MDSRKAEHFFASMEVFHLQELRADLKRAASHTGRTMLGFIEDEIQCRIDAEEYRRDQDRIDQDYYAKQEAKLNT